MSKKNEVTKQEQIEEVKVELESRGSRRVQLDELRNDLKEIRASLREMNQYFRDKNISDAQKRNRLPIMEAHQKELLLWVTSINTDAKLVQTNVNVVEQNRLIERFANKEEV